MLELEELTLEYCRQRGLIINRDTENPEEGKVDLIIQNGNENEGIGVIIKDWKRAVGVDIVIRAEKIMKNHRLITKILIITNYFSDPARSLAEKIRIFLLTRNDLIRILSSDLNTNAIEKGSDNQENVILY